MGADSPYYGADILPVPNAALQSPLAGKSFTRS